jgi:TonB-linked SusC/RagA family outer membrane protein
MKLSILLVLLGILQAKANVNAQGSITLTMQQAEIVKVLNKIEKKGEFRFLYNYDLASLRRKVNVNFQNSDLRRALGNLFAGTDLTYKVLENNLVVVMSNGPEKQAIRITGIVTGVANEPLVSVSVRVKGTDLGTSTDNKGEYSLTVEQNANLLFSYIGYADKEIKVNGQNVINVQLSPSDKILDQAVVIGYGSQKKKDITSAISTIDTKDISSRPIISAVDAITGKAPGVQVLSPSGQPGADLSVRVRGVGSPNGGEPLYVVDGVLANDIRTIDPNTIESISVLKDASAAGIYGAAGSTNGVVMITTKQGARGKSRVDASVYTGMQQIVKKIPVLNNQQWLSLQTEIQGAAPTIPSYYNLTTTNNNWQDMVYHHAMQTGANVGVSGGSEKGTYYFGGGYLNQDGIMRGTNFQRYSVKLSIDQNANNWLRLGGNVSYNRSNQRTVTQNASAQNGGAVMSALITPQYIPVFMPAGSPNPGVYGYSSFYSGENPISDIYNNSNKTIANNLLGNAFAEIKLPFGIKYRSQLNVILENSKYDKFLDPYKSLTGMAYQGQGNSTYSEVFRWAWDNTLSYTHTFGLHSISVMAGTSALNETIALSNQSGQGFASSSVQTLNGASNNLSVNTENFQWSTNSYFGRINYAFNDKYLIAATLRADGSSRLGFNTHWGTFPAASVGWKVSKEDFMQNVNWMQDLKIRAGWGETGNLPPYTMLYPAYTLLSAGAPYLYSAGSASPGVIPSNQGGNPNLKWESAQQTNIGFDAGFLNSRLTLSADYYYKKVKDMIFTNQLPLTTGGLISAINMPGYDINKGFEFSIDAGVVREKDFSWDLMLNMSFNNNKISGLDTAITYQTGGVNVGGSKAPIYTGIIKNGYSLGTFWGYIAEGVDPQTGNFKYSANPTDLGNALPKYTFGITSTFRYKGFTLQLLFDGVHGNKIYDETRMEIEALSGYANESAAVLGRWEKPGDNTSIPRALGNGTTNAIPAALLQSQISSNYVEDGSFFRLRNTTLGYEFNGSKLKQLGVASIRLYATAQNLFTITKYKGYYPEINSFGQGTNNLATHANEGPTLLALGVDNGTYPAAKTYIVGLNIQF